MNTAGLSTDQAPPIAVPLSWYALVPLALLAAGALLVVDGARLLATGWLQPTAGLTHLGTLGLLGAAMLGSLYQMVPVVAGAPVPLARWSPLVAGLFAVGVAGLVAGLRLFDLPTLRWATWLLGAAVTAALLPIAWALLRAPAPTLTVQGMRLALLSLAALAGLGLRLAWGHATGQLPMERQGLLTAHLALGLLGWVGALLAAVSWQIVPMFWMTAAVPQRWSRLLLGCVAASAAAVLALALAGLGWRWVALAALPAALAVWLGQPWQLWRLLQQRRRKRSEPSLQLWQLSLLLGPVTWLAGLVWALVDWGPLGPLWGWLALWGWAGAAVHGAIGKIVPFLAWFHRFAQTADRPELQARVPPMKQLLPDRLIRAALFLHAAALLLGVAAILSGWDPLARLTGVALLATAALWAAEVALPVWRAWRVR